MKKSVLFDIQFAPKLGGQFELESGGQFAPELVVNLHWKVMVNLTGFSSKVKKPEKPVIIKSKFINIERDFFCKME